MCNVSSHVRCIVIRLYIYHREMIWKLSQVLIWTDYYISDLSYVMIIRYCKQHNTHSYLTFSPCADQTPHQPLWLYGRHNHHASNQSWTSLSIYGLIQIQHRMYVYLRILCSFTSASYPIRGLYYVHTYINIHLSQNNTLIHIYGVIIHLIKTKYKFSYC